MIASKSCPRVAIWDLDNCLSDDRHRMPLIDWREGLSPDERYRVYHSRLADDAAANRELFDALSVACRPVFFTARPASMRRETRLWITQRLGAQDAELHMRPDGCFIGSVQLKRRMVIEFGLWSAGVRRIVAAFDDRQDVVDMYRNDFGIPACTLRIHDICPYTNPDTKEKLHDN